MAQELKTNKSAAARWVSADALRELVSDATMNRPKSGKRD
jgi:hypothetical protein